jgi:FtsP/CotA-like multicopper oxidase with cupredoxin domain
LRFSDFVGKYIMHCHNTVHEDHAMMVRWDVVP